MTLAKDELGIDVIERRINRSELYLADEVFLTGTAAHLTPVGRIDNRDIGDGETGPLTISNCATSTSNVLPATTRTIWTGAQASRPAAARPFRRIEADPYPDD